MQMITLQKFIERNSHQSTERKKIDIDCKDLYHYELVIIEILFVTISNRTEVEFFSFILR